jgi:hypothetical protein
VVSHAATSAITELVSVGRPDFDQLVRLLAAVEQVEDGADVVGQGVFGGDDLVSGLDVDGVVAAQRGDEFLDGLSGFSLEPSGDREGADTIVRWASMESRLW